MRRSLILYITVVVVVFVVLFVVYHNRSGAATGLLSLGQGLPPGGCGRLAEGCRRLLILHGRGSHV